MSFVRFVNNLVRSTPREIWNSFRKLDDIKYGTIIGIDQFGNKYYENREELYGRDRWVVTAAPRGETDANKIPPLWHAWLHHTIDEVPPQGDKIYENKPKWWDTSKNNFNPTGTPMAFKTYNTTQPKFSSWEPKVTARN
ncbi:hypothetical protein H4219_002106 [Mycoemilia scoparia]|uniref:NADH dehydrogenase [ubiquinone] 1 alpha subcomplex subunit n=1 Tax=Mycoemilia scoparia TaxID=417184 RepID=A0A9W7ZYM7_9FUNG|nr:hypothetical protein H4219_002106 [Mycoemilia scoparia]